MEPEYVYKTIRLLLEQRTSIDPSGVPFNDVVGAVVEDLKMVLNALVDDGKLSFKIDINKQPIFYDNV